MEKFQKEKNMGIKSLTTRQMENRKVTSEQLMKRHQQKNALYQISTGNENRIYLIFPNEEYREFSQAKYQHRLQDHILLKRMPANDPFER
ncbi:hypothetical protein NPIL_191831 [Nephila pilipes]|uniref:Uncharacterized protein n=1 Tax=Nephila pilipes TaxID=299642 RepID=A0A8X6PYY0_NEPPI|nr:hypothetical protein NPIL_191831 [Nephila pilipes]